MQAQVARKENKLIAARAALLQCSRLACPAVVRSDCGDWLTDVTRRMPTVVLAAHSKNGDEASVRVSMDDRPFVDRLDGTALEVDPGAHTFVFSLGSREPVVQKVIIREGEKDRTISVQFDPVVTTQSIAAPPPPDAPVDQYRPVPWEVFALAGVSVVGVGVFAGFGLAGTSSRNALQTSCAPFCSPSEANSVQTKFLIADISLGGAIAAAGTSLVILVARPTIKRKRSTASGAPSLFITPYASGARAGVDLTF